MNTDLKLFSKVANRLVYLTTRDEHGSLRSKGIEDYQGLSAELNDVGIVPARGFWTENSLKLFINRIRSRYSWEEMASECDLDFLGRQAWEYVSHSRIEDVCEPRRMASTTQWWFSAPESYPVSSPIFDDYQFWKEHEVDEVVRDDKKMEKFLDS